MEAVSKDWGSHCNIPITHSVVPHLALGSGSMRMARCDPALQGSGAVEAADARAASNNTVALEAPI